MAKIVINKFCSLTYAYL